MHAHGSLVRQEIAKRQRVMAAAKQRVVARPLVSSSPTASSLAAPTASALAAPTASVLAARTACALATDDTQVVDMSPVAKSLKQAFDHAADDQGQPRLEAAGDHEATSAPGLEVSSGMHGSPRPGSECVALPPSQDVFHDDSVITREQQMKQRDELQAQGPKGDDEELQETPKKGKGKPKAKAKAKSKAKAKASPKKAAAKAKAKAKCRPKAKAKSKAKAKAKCKASRKCKGKPSKVASPDNHDEEADEHDKQDDACVVSDGAAGEEGKPSAASTAPKTAEPKKPGRRSKQPESGHSPPKAKATFARRYRPEKDAWARSKWDALKGGFQLYVLPGVCNAPSLEALVICSHVGRNCELEFACLAECF